MTFCKNRNMKKLLLFFLLLTGVFVRVEAQHVLFPEETGRQYISDSLFIPKKKPFLAAAEVFATNTFVWSFNKAVLNADFAQISWNSWKTNLSSFPVWDTDKFSTNLFAHPYHGGLYFNAARSNGMSFWESVPFSFGGSLMWEYFGENELPSINDLYATTLGGMCLGEITFRLSDLFVDNSSTGWERFSREFLIACISPVRGVNRLLNGQSWKRTASKGRELPSVPIYFNVFAGGRFLAEYDDSKNGELSTHIGVNLIYGEPFRDSYDEYYKPYEWFTLNIGADLFSNQPLFTQVNVIGILWGKNIDNSEKYSLTLGAFQHFDFYDSQIKNGDGEKFSPYRISEAAAFGIGSLFVRRYNLWNKPLIFRSTGYVNGIVLGGNTTDHYFNNERDYNLGSGFSIKLYAGATYKGRWSFDLSAEHFYLYTWRNTSQGRINNSQGDAGHSHLTVLSPYITYHSGKKWNITLRNRHFIRSTYYKYYPNVRFSTTDFVITLGYTL